VKKILKKCVKNKKHRGKESGSGWVAVILVPLERGDGGGQNDTNLVVAVAVLREIWLFM
jgi:hypothetical protein